MNLREYLKDQLPKARPDIQPEVIKSMYGLLGRLEHPHFRPWKIHGVEEQFTTTFWEATNTEPAYIITCCLDLVVMGRDDTSILIYDWKTGQKRWTSDDAFNAFQTQFGSFVLFKEIETVKEIHWFYDQTRFDCKPAYAGLFRKRDYHNFQGRIASVLRLAKEGCKEAWPYDEKCCWCPATAICPHVIAEARDFNDDRKGYLKQYIALTARCKTMKGVMNEYCKQHGEIRADGQVFGDKGRQKVEFSVFKDG